VSVIVKREFLIHLLVSVSLHKPATFIPILHKWLRDSCFTCDGFSTIWLRVRVYLIFKSGHGWLAILIEIKMFLNLTKNFLDKTLGRYANNIFYNYFSKSVLGYLTTGCVK
jgi:hypothetical protein